MRKFVTFDEELLKEAKKLLGITNNSQVVKLALLDRISAEAQNKLAKLGGYDPNFGRIVSDEESEK